MAKTILFSLAVEVLKKVGSAAFTEISSAWVFKTQLKKLENTINTLKDVLLDAEDRQADSLAVRGWLERLSTVVYAADDLFDEFNTVAKRKELMDGHKMIMEVCTFFSPNNQVLLALKIYWNIKKIREKLDDIKKEGESFGFVCRSLERGSAMSRSDQTTPYVHEDNVVGREGHKKAIVKMLVESSSTGLENGHDEGITVIPIVGMGGMGKTTLAQLIYNDPQVNQYFDLRLWVYVSEVFDIKIIIDKLLKSATRNETPHLEMAQLESLWREEVANKNYLLVLDDVWNESRDEWLKLSEKLKIGKRGSKILVTTRSLKVATSMGVSHPYQLQVLTEEESWKLFKKMAFRTPEEAQQKPHLLKIGEEIVEKCGRVPLAIRTLGCLLFDKEKEEWLSIKNKSLAKILNIMDILKLSYHHLSSPLQKCFAYCALFPKDYRFDKEMLIDLWIAEEFIVLPSDDDQSLDEVAEDYFHTLLQRGFFQDAERYFWELTKIYTMHDFMHDLAETVAGVKCKVAKSDGERTFDEKSVHLSLAYQLTPSWEIPSAMLNMKLLHTFLLPDQTTKWSPSSKSISLLPRFRSLRVLDLNELDLKILPSSIGKLIHLRYLYLSFTPIEKLSDSITNLWNLQTLKLRGCRELKELPANMRKLINLRSLDVEYCNGLSHMPSGLGQLTSLTSLPLFIVDSRYKPTAKLSDLKNLNKLRGTLKISIKGNLEDSMVGEADLMSNKHQLTELKILFPFGDGVSDGEATDCNHDEAVLQGLQPPSNIKSLSIIHYRGEKVPSWMDNLCTTLPHLVKIDISYWKRCQQLPVFSQLPLLKYLHLGSMESVEYIERHDVGGVPPSLEQLHLNSMRNLKGWWKEEEASVNENDTSESASNELAAQNIPTFMQFSELSKLRIYDCPNLRMLPLCPNLENLTLHRADESLSLSTGSGLKLKTLKIDNAEALLSVPNHCLPQLSYLEVDGDKKLENTERLGDFANFSSSLRSLTFQFCLNLRSIAKGLEHLSNLETLDLQWCGQLDVSGDEDEMPWKAFKTSLRSLTFRGLHQLVGLPRGLQHLSNLRDLTLSSIHKLEEVPEWINCFSSLEYLELHNCPKLRCLPDAFRQLTSLIHLRIETCPELKERCQGPNGSDWPKIQHIPDRSIRD